MLKYRKKENWSVFVCELGCKPLKTRSEKAALTWIKDPHIIARFIQPPTCPYTHMKIDGEFYKRDTGDIHGDKETYQRIVEPRPDPIFCFCSVPLGNHVGCGMEKCPICDDQFISC